jgi:SAM-dependent methyltransferase
VVERRHRGDEARVVTREQRLVFGEVAELYDRARPAYPDGVFDHIVADAGIDPDVDRLLEVGAGTATATVPFAARGYVVTALEPSPEMAAVARRNLAPYPDVTLVDLSFEDWAIERAAFGLVYSATAWHWVTPGVRVDRAHAALRDGGTLAIFSFRPTWPENAVSAAIDEVYARVAPGCSSRLPGSRTPTQESKWRSCVAELTDSDAFATRDHVRIPWPGSLTTAEFLDLLRTQSNHRLLAPETLERLLAGVGGVIDDAGGAVPVDADAELLLARRVP